GASINDQGSIAFSGWNTIAVALFGTDTSGVFLADKHGQLESIADPAGGVFGWVGVPKINSRGDVAYAGRLATQPPFVNSIFLTSAATAQTITLAKPGDVSDQGEVLRSLFWPRINDAGQVAFADVQDIDRPIGLSVLRGLFVYSSGSIRHVTAPGDAVSGGGHVSILPSID